MSGEAKPSPFRADIHRLEVELFQHNQRVINESVEGYTDEFRRYERRYRRAVKTSRGPAPFEQLIRATLDAKVIAVGDYHTYSHSQRSFFRILRAQPPDSEVIIALEMILGKHQEDVDRFVTGRISEKSFLRRIEHAKHWPFGPFDAVRPIFELAKERGWRVIGIDRRAPSARSLRDRDEFAADRIAEALEARPGARLFALIGEMHLAPQHLPRSIAKALRRRRMEGTILRVHQNPDPIWFEYAERGLADEHDVVEIDGGAYALLTASPVVFQQSFLTWLETVQEGEPTGRELSDNAGEQNVRHAVHVIDRALELGAGDALKGVDVVGPANLSFFEDLYRSGRFTRRELREIRKHILSSESCYIPKARMIYLATPSVNHAAEEASHLLRHYTSGENLDDPKGLVDAFYSRVMNEAIGFFGSKIVNPKRKCTHLPELQALAARGVREGFVRDLDLVAARHAVEHKRMERGEIVPQIAHVFHAPPDLFNAVTHLLGYILGDQLYYAVARGKLPATEARALYFEPLDEDGAAILLYFELIQRVGKVKPPKRP